MRLPLTGLLTFSFADYPMTLHVEAYKMVGSGLPRTRTYQSGLQ